MVKDGAVWYDWGMSDTIHRKDEWVKLVGDDWFWESLSRDKASLHKATWPEVVYGPWYDYELLELST